LGRRQVIRPFPTSNSSSLTALRRSTVLSKRNSRQRSDRSRRAGALLLGLVASVVAVFHAAAAPDASPHSSLGFEFCAPLICAPPFRPTCVDLDATYHDNKSIVSCQDNLTRYAENVNAYRACLFVEVERAIKETNSTIDRFKCGTSAKRPCPK
jgi:hypothetical protein